MGGLEVNHATSLLEGDAVADGMPVTTCLKPNKVEEPRIWKAVLRLLDEQEPRNRTSKLELPIPSVLVRLPAPSTDRKTFPLYKTSGLVNQLDVASWKHPGRSPPSESTHEDDNVVDEDRGVGARCPHGSLDNTGWDLHCIDERQAGKSYVVL